MRKLLTNTVAPQKQKAERVISVIQTRVPISLNQTTKESPDKFQFGSSKKFKFSSQKAIASNKLKALLFTLKKRLSFQK